MGSRPRSVAAILTLALLLAPPGEGQGGAAATDSRTDYTIQARLDGAQKTLTGSLRLRWTNGSEAEADDLWFHLYHNAFANNRSTHMVQSDGRLRGVRVEDGWGWQRVTSLRVGGEELVGRLTFRAPDDGNEEDRTVFSVDLDRPVAPGETLEVEVDWEAQVPRVRRRTGYKDDFLLMAHWFPKLGVFEGERGWNCHQFHMNTEFYADYGRYDVTLDLPLEYRDKVAASGVQHRAPVVSGDRVRIRFMAPSLGDLEFVDDRGRRPLVHGFAWAADPDFVVREGTFQYEEWEQRYLAEVNGTAAALGVERDALRLRDVTVRVFLQPEREAQFQRHFDATCTALFFYGLWFGGYPYETVSVIDPPWGGGAAGGMEYPTLFTCGTSLFTRPQMYRPESVTVHEAGHQFWYGLVGNNEFEAAWLDEGLNSYSDSEALVRRYGPRRRATSYARLYQWGAAPAPAPGGSPLADALAGRRLRLPGIEAALEPLRVSDFVGWWRDVPRLTFVEEWTDPRWSDRSGYLRDPDSDPVERGGSWKYVDGASYRTNSYPRPAVAVRSLAAVVGREAFQRGMRRFADEWRFRHPYPEDFYAAFREEGVDIDWYFEDLFRGTGTIDWSVQVDQRREAEPRGMFPDAEGRFMPLEDEAATGEEASEGGEPEGDEAVLPEDGEALPGEDSPGARAVEPGDTAGRVDEPAAQDAGDGAAPRPEAAQQPDPQATPEGGAPPPPDDPLPEPGLAEDEQVDEEPEEPAGRPWRYDVVVRAGGELSLPVVVEVTFEDGEEQRFTWTREAQLEERWWRLPIEPGTRRLRSVVIDPERLYYLDTDMSDNQWFDERERIAPLRWGERLWTRYGHLLHWYSTLGG